MPLYKASDGVRLIARFGKKKIGLAPNLSKRHRKALFAPKRIAEKNENQRPRTKTAMHP